MTTKILLYNKALSHLSTIRLASLTEVRPERYALDDAYDGVLQSCLEEGLWKFAKRTVKLDADTGITPEFGPQYAFGRPTDFVRIMAFASDERLSAELAEWVDENEVWYADTTPLYLQYVSNGATYGLNLGNYPEYYAEWVGVRLALRASLPVTKDRTTRNDLLTLDTRYLAKAKKLGAVDEPIKRAPVGRLVSARRGVGNNVTVRGGRLTWS